MIKRFLSIAALALAGTLIMGCNDLEDIQSPDEDSVELVKITLSLDESPQTRALTIEGNKGIKTFAVDDKIVVFYDKNLGRIQRVESVKLTQGDITNGGKSATFTVSLPSGNNNKPINGGRVRYIYPASMAVASTPSNIDDAGTINYEALASQFGTLETLGSNFDLAVCDGTAPAQYTLPTTGTLENKLTICAFTLKTSDGSEITGSTTTIIREGTNIYTVNHWAATNPIYVAMRPTENADIEITATTGTDTYTKTLTGKTYLANNGYNLSIRMTQQPGVHNGFFTINASGKMVKFSPGNLQATYNAASNNWTWGFAAHQYDFLGNTSGNVLINGNGTLSGDGIVDLFGWSTNSNYYGINNSTSDDDYSGSFLDWGSLDIDGNGTNYWKTMSSAAESTTEWWYLMRTRATGATINGTANARFTVAKINTDGETINGIIIFPDSYNGPTADKGDDIKWGNKINDYSVSSFSNGASCTIAGWEELENAGCVFLPAGGYRSGNTVYNANSEVRYSSSTSKSTTEINALSYVNNTVYWNLGNKYKREGAAVRLVHIVN